jgi:hypothetical protein
MSFKGGGSAPQRRRTTFYKPTGGSAPQRPHNERITKNTRSVAVRLDRR